MEEREKSFYLVRQDVLPEAMRKTIEVKQLLESGVTQTINEAVQKVDLSRSAYYKYKDTVYPFKTIVQEKIITLFFYIEDRTGTLSKLLKIVAEADCNILTIHQTIPIQGKANVTLSLDVSAITEDIETLIHTLKQLEFVKRVDMLSSGT
ncbi:MAG TPA: ACT domain-containing protein [Bacillota bacterium]|nr:ACT domain-containing protein [Bacillota bacterium]